MFQCSAFEKIIGQFLGTFLGWRSALITAYKYAAVYSHLVRVCFVLASEKSNRKLRKSSEVAKDFKIVQTSSFSKRKDFHSAIILNLELIAIY